MQTKSKEGAGGVACVAMRSVDGSVLFVVATCWCKRRTVECVYCDWGEGEGAREGTEVIGESGRAGVDQLEGGEGDDGCDGLGRCRCPEEEEDGECVGEDFLMVGCACVYVREC